MDITQIFFKDHLMRPLDTESDIPIEEPCHTENINQLLETQPIIEAERISQLQSKKFFPLKSNDDLK